ncbi:MAG: UTP--glucose-1-phosphate uridylyltransferase [Verrucomicrobiales bacterium]
MSGPVSPSETPFAAIRQKMEFAGLDAAAIRAFHASFAALERGATGMISEAEIVPVDDLPNSSGLSSEPHHDLLAQTVVIKLNGGLGTSMGLEKAKSLLRVREKDTFIDLIARQILCLRARTGRSVPRFVLMNSFSTSQDTCAHIAHRFPQLGDPASLELMQNRVPKLDAATFQPIKMPGQPELDWCPPGHGDIYACLLGSGLLDRLLSENILYAFVSNSDNLGATLDPALLAFFAKNGRSFLMEVTRRTVADRKGGHLAIRKNDGRFVLRESAQCPKPDETAFQDINRHAFFNTNNLWIRLDHLSEELRKHDGLIPLPVIINRKTADPRDLKSPSVIQLETAMGAAIEAFPRAAAIEVPRMRFAPVKTTSDLLAVRSDAFTLTEDFRLELHPDRRSEPPALDLDPRHYRLVDGLEAAFPHGAPSLRFCRSLTVRGPIQCDAAVTFVGDVLIQNQSDRAARLRTGAYEGEFTFP